MKNLKTLIIMAVILTACQPPAPKTECPKAPLTEMFMSQIFLRGDKSVTFEDGSFEVFRSDVFEDLVKKGMDGTIKLGDPLIDPLDAEKQLLTVEEVKRKTSFIDTQYVESAVPPHDLEMTVIKDSLDPNLFVSVRPYEKWTMDENFKLTRDVLAYVPVCDNVDRTTGKVRGLEPYFYVASDEHIGEAKKIGTIRYQQPIIGDFGSWYRENLEGSARQKMFEPIFRKAWEGALPTYSSPEAASASSLNQLKSTLCRVDTLYKESAIEPYDMEMTTVKECQSTFQDQVIAIEFVQDVYLYENMAISIDVKWYAPVVKIVDPITWKTTGSETLFWIKN